MAGDPQERPLELTNSQVVNRGIGRVPSPPPTGVLSLRMSDLREDFSAKYLESEG